MTSRIFRVALCVAMAAGTVLGFSAMTRRPNVGLHLTTTTSSSLFYVRNTPPDPAIPTPVPVIGRSKVKIETISSLYELQYFLQEDERPVAIKFFAPWCKTCQKLGHSFLRVARERGDTVHDRQKVRGDIRFAQVEYNPRSASFITDTLRIPGVPTLQLYHGTHKLWEELGPKSIHGLQDALDSIKGLSPDELSERSHQRDDGILQAAMEDLFFQPDFLNEEW